MVGDRNRGVAARETMYLDPVDLSVALTISSYERAVLLHLAFRLLLCTFRCQDLKAEVGGVNEDSNIKLLI